MRKILYIVCLFAVGMLASVFVFGAYICAICISIYWVTRAIMMSHLRDMLSDSYFFQVTIALFMIYVWSYPLNIYVEKMRWHIFLAKAVGGDLYRNAAETDGIYRNAAAFESPPGEADFEKADAESSPLGETNDDEITEEAQPQEATPE